MKEKDGMNLIYRFKYLVIGVIIANFFEERKQRD
jgi:hypothetical protein